MTARDRRSVVVLGMVTKMPVPGVLWQTLHYLEGLRRLGYDVLYVEDHARCPSMFVGEGDAGSERAAAFLRDFLVPFGLGNRWAFRATHDDGTCFGRTEAGVIHAYESADLILNLHGGTRPRPEHTRTGRLVYVGTDPVQLEIELWQERQESYDFLDAHCAVFTFGENYGAEDCGLPVSDRYRFRPTRQPVVLDFWATEEPPGGDYTTIANWHQPFRTIRYRGEVYHWSKDREFRRFLALPARTDASFELALSSISAEERRELEARGWRVREPLGFDTGLDEYRGYIQRSRGEFTVAKDQNVRLRSGWFSDRSATYLAAGRPVVTQETGFSAVLPTGDGLFAFETLDEAAAAIEAIESDPAAASGAAREVARECFDHRVVLAAMLAELGVEGPAPSHAVPAGAWPPPLPDDLVLEPASRRPLELEPRTTTELLGRLWPPPAAAPEPQTDDRRRRGGLPAGTTGQGVVEPDGPSGAGVPPDRTARTTSVIVVTHGRLELTRLCLESLLRGTESGDWELVVVDNASPDRTPEYLRGLAAFEPRVRLVLNPRNEGFAAACNQGAAVADGDVLVFLNNDTAVAPGWLGSLLAHLDEEDVGAVNAVTNRVGTEAEVAETPRSWRTFLEAASRRREERRGEAREAEMLAFFCLAIRRETWQTIGPLDERYGLGLFEDDDYSMRIATAAYRMVCAEDVLVLHMGEASFGSLVADGRYARLFERNRALFEETWGRPWSPHRGGPDAAYRALVERITKTLAQHVAADETVAVVSRGDPGLLRLEHARALHFPAAHDGGWAGHYPADGEGALRALDHARQRGARYFAVPAPAAWWLDHYDELRIHLARHAETIVSDEALTLFRLRKTPGTGATAPRPVFIVGSPRSGTSILTWALGQHPNLYPLEETVWFGRFHRGLDEAFELGSSRGERSQLSAMDIDRTSYVEAFGRTVDRLILDHRAWPDRPVPPDELFARARRPEDPKRRWIDGTPENSFFVDGLVELFPRARFIHLLREPAAVVRSLRRFDLIGGRRHSATEAYDRWLRHVRACLDAEASLGGGAVLRVEHRSLVDDAEGVVHRCLDFCGEPYHPDCLLPLSRRINSSGSGPDPLPDDAPADPELVEEAEALGRELLAPVEREPVGGGGR